MCPTLNCMVGASFCSSTGVGLLPQNSVPIRSLLKVTPWPDLSASWMWPLSKSPLIHLRPSAPAAVLNRAFLPSGSSISSPPASQIQLYSVPVAVSVLHGCEIPHCSPGLVSLAAHSSCSCQVVGGLFGSRPAWVARPVLWKGT